MLLKIALTVAIIGAVWIFMIRATGRRGKVEPRPQPKRVESLERCPACGTYRLYGEPCACSKDS